MPEHFATYRRSTGTSVESYLQSRGITDPRSVFVVFRERPTGYIVFADHHEYIDWVEGIPQAERVFHEVIPDGPQRLKFDIDADAAELGRVQLARRDTSIHDDTRAALCGTSPKFDLVCAIIAEAISDVFMLKYAREPTLIVCESRDKTRPVKKYSRHLIIDGFYVSSAAQAREFTTTMTRFIPKEIRRFLDTSVNKSLQNFRIAGCTKAGDDRIKTITTCHDTTDTFITATCGLIKLPDIVTPDAQPVRVSLPAESEVSRIFNAAGLNAHHRFRARNGNLYMFNRTSPSYCEFCQRIHDSDNTLILTTTDPTEEGIVDVRMSCRKYTAENGRAKSRAIGSYIHVTDPCEDMPLTTRPSRLERIVHGGVAADPELFTTTPPADRMVYSAPSLRKFRLHPTSVIHAAMKMGKTKMLREYIAENFPADSIAPNVIRFVSFRQTFGSNIKENFPDFTLYSDVKGAVLDQPRLIVQVESLHRIEITDTPPDLLILDECESIFEQFESGLIRRFAQTCAVFIYLLKHARHVICMDANITSRTEAILREIRGGDPPHYHHNTHQNACDYSYRITSAYPVWAALLDRCIAAGERVAVPVSSLRLANALYDTLSRRHPQKTVMIYSSETSQAIKTEHFANINKSWAKYDVVIYTPTVTAGVSFEARHFDRVYGYFTSTSCCDLSCIQMLGRIRDVAKREITLCIMAVSADYPVESDEIIDLFYARRQCLFSENNGIYPEYNVTGELVLHKTPYFHIWVQNTRARNLSRNYFEQRLITAIRLTGARIEYIPPSGHDVELTEAVRTIREDIIESSARDAEQKCAAVADAPDADDYAIADIHARMDAGVECSAAEVNIMRRYGLRTHYNYNGAITSQWVKAYIQSIARQRYRNLCQLGAGDDRSLAQLRACDAAMYKSNMGLDERYHHVDIQRKYYYTRHNLAARLVRACGFSGIYDTKYVHRANIDGVAASRAVVVAAAREFEWGRPPPSADDGEALCLLLATTSKVLSTMYGFSLKITDSLINIIVCYKYAYPNVECNGVRLHYAETAPKYGPDAYRPSVKYTMPMFTGDGEDPLELYEDVTPGDDLPIYED